MRRLVGLLLCVEGACRPPAPHQDAPGECLALSAAARRQLITDGDHALYWLEDVPQYDFDGRLRPDTELMRFDLQDRTPRRIASDVVGPVLWMHGEIVALRPMPPTFNTALVAIHRDGLVAGLVPDHFEVLDFEPIDDQRVALLAEGEGPRGIYTLSLDGGRPVRLMDADGLQTVAEGRVFALVGDRLVAADPSTGKQDQLVRRPHAVPNDRYALWVDRDVVRERNMLTGHERSIVGDKQPWKLVYQAGSVLARSKPDKDNASHAYLIVSGSARKLPSVIGGATIVGTTELAGQTWALIGHNTPHFSGDFGDGRIEADVCLLPAAGHVAFPTRRVPGRYAEQESRLFAVAETVAPKARIGIDDVTGKMTTLTVETPERLPDLDAMRARAREIDQQLTSVLGDPNVRTDVQFGDRMHARVTWSRDHKRRRTVVGMGDAVVTDNSELDVEIQNLDETNKDGKITCAGTMINLQPRPLDDVEVWCVRDRQRIVRIPHLEPSARVEFRETFDAKEHDDLDLDFYGNGRPLLVRLARGEALLRSMMDLATGVYAETGLWLDSHDGTDETFDLTLYAAAGWDDKPLDERSKIAATAYERYRAGVANLSKSWANARVMLHIEVEVAGTAYTFDGDTLEQD